MNEVEKYRGHVVDHTSPHLENLPVYGGHSPSNLLLGILRRWYIVLVIFFVMCAVGIPAIWLLIEPLYGVTGAIRVAPILPNILTGERDRGELSTYQSFLYTQSEMITSNHVVQRVADDLADKNLTFFQNGSAGFVKKLNLTLNDTKTKPELASILKQAVSGGIISAAPARNTELIKITARTKNVDEAAQIVDAFIDGYMAVEVSSSTEDEERRLSVLEDEYKILAQRLKDLREKIKVLADEFGSESLDKRQEMKLERVGMLLTEVTRWEASRIHLEAQVEVLKNRLETGTGEEGQTVEQEKLEAKMDRVVDHNDPARREYINDDPTLIAYITNLTELEQALLIARQRLAATNPELENRVAVIESLKQRIEARKTELGDMYDNFKAKQIADVQKEKLQEARKELESIQSELELTRAYEQRFKEMLAQEDTETIDVGRRQLEIQELQDELSLTKEAYERVGRRIDELKMERKRPARVSVAYYADVASVRDKRVKYSMALIFGAFACGAMAALLLDKADLRLRTPEDVVKRIGIRIIGTTTSSDTIKKTLLPKQLAGDYQTIRANLRLLNGERMPKKLVITSPGMREGKTTFAINLATSMAGAGEKVLLIDGDLRKPDIARLLNLPKGSRGLQDILFGRNINQAVYSVASSGLDVLAADARNRDDAYELLALPVARQNIDAISQQYDHVIIDTPPMLAFPDALVWAKIADAVILTSFASQTTAPDLREATEKLIQINVNVLGAVLSNVGASQSYYRYGYNYYAQKERSKENYRRAAIKLLLPMQTQEEDAKDLDT